MIVKGGEIWLPAFRFVVQFLEDRAIKPKIQLEYTVDYIVDPKACELYRASGLPDVEEKLLLDEGRLINANQLPKLLVSSNTPFIRLTRRYEPLIVANIKKRSAKTMTEDASRSIPHRKIVLASALDPPLSMPHLRMPLPPRVAKKTIEVVDLT